MTAPTQPTQTQQKLPRTLTRDLGQHDGQPVRLQGFVHARRDLGGVQFVVLRDKSGVAQCVGSGAASAAAREQRGDCRHGESPQESAGRL